MKNLILGEYPGFKGNELWWDAVLTHIESESPDKEEVFLVELKNENIIPNPMDEFNIVQSLHTLHRFKWKNYTGLENIIGSKEKKAIETELKNEKTFEYAGFLYCNSKYCTVVIQE
tara:strand:+ start:2785 stop:3132 length:348 start_codon:yes stop_codon:yes gene_type:complete